MTDELDKLKTAFEATREDPDQAARRRAVAAALDAYDAENASATQDSSAGVRPTRHRANWFARLYGGFSMRLTYRRLNPVLLGGASLATIAVAMIVAYDYPQSRLEGPDFAPDSAIEQRENRAGSRDEAAALGDGKTAAPAPALPAESNEVQGHASMPAAPATPAPQRRLQGASNAEVVGNMAGSGSQTMDRLSSTLEGDNRRLFEKQASEVTGQDLAARSERSVVESEEMAAEPRARVALKEAKQSTAPAQTKSDDAVSPTYQDQGRDNFADIEANPVKVVAEEPVSTFSIDVDTASYAFVRSEILRGVMPQKDAVRVEEMVNYFPYDYPLPESSETPFRADVQVIPTPWNDQTRLMRIGIQGYALAEAEKPRSNLVFLIDSSGSMNAPDKLPLLKNALKLMLEALDADDTVAIVTYAGAAGTVLEPTPVAEASRILAALERLHAGGSTAGAEGIRQAYQLAEANYDAEGINRVILATDGDFNVGITDIGELQGFVERKRKTGVLLSILGFGQGNLNDALMQALAQNGNGQAAYIDTLSEARKALVEEAGSTLFPIAKDVKIQIEFNPAAVSEYRLIGYETRMLRREDFNNDKVDAGEIGSGHRVTALYEITPAGAGQRQVDPLRYQAVTELEANPSELAFLKIRYKPPGSDTSKLVETPVTRGMEFDAGDSRTRETQFAAAVAGFGQLLRGGRHMGDFTYDDVAALGQGAKGDDPFGYRAEFLNLVRLAKSAAALEPLK